MLKYEDHKLFAEKFSVMSQALRDIRNKLLSEEDETENICILIRDIVQRIEQVKIEMNDLAICSGCEDADILYAQAVIPGWYQIVNNTEAYDKTDPPYGGM